MTPDIEYEREEILDLIATALTDDEGPEREAIICELQEGCATAQDLADRYNEVFKEGHERCIVLCAEKGIYGFSDE